MLEARLYFIFPLANVRPLLVPLHRASARQELQNCLRHHHHHHHLRHHHHRRYQAIHRVSPKGELVTDNHQELTDNCCWKSLAVF